ncbi:prolyl oligopeptidase family serine peptidase [Qipengyuania sp. RANM35]|uniref:S9 family peptidase n=1 Tax=Qipengyuania sp. RANM35 TaxID=3068635 RepID=UPI0034DACACA
MVATVSDPSISPDGTQVVYSVSTPDIEQDRNSSDIWIAATDGSGERRLTGRKGESASTPRFSPDGSYVAFLSSRGGKDDAPDRLWLLPMAGGEAMPIEGMKGSVSDYAWAPDGRSIVLVVTDPKPEPVGATDEEKTRPRPIVIDRYWYKEDNTGFLDNRRSRLFHYDLRNKTARRLTDGDFDERLPAFSPDGSHIAFVSNRQDDPDRTTNTDIFVARVAALGATPRQLTTFKGADSPTSPPAWSPDGRRIAYVRSGEPETIWYGVSPLAVVDAEGGPPTILTGELDRNIFSPVWTENSRAVRFIVEDDGKEYLAQVPASGGEITRLAEGEYVLASPSAVAKGRMALLRTSSFAPAEVYAFADGRFTQLSRRNDSWLKDLEFGSVRKSSFASADGTRISGFVYIPIGHREGQRHATVLNLHGGPTAQFNYGWDAEILWQLAAGYVVLAPNPRGSTGRGEQFALGIDAAWGSVDVADVLAAVDHAVAEGIADPDRLGVSGWSYGGMLTNYVIASDTRFKAAVSGASISNVITGFGHDQYLREYIAELGAPWENLQGWLRVSYPFFENQRIKTPTLFLVGKEDVNVPTIASEQMYQALRHRGIDTQLVIYPGEFHTIRRPSFYRDRMERWNAWLNRFLKN